ncbi:restriction endonuclease subunit S [Treponema denticola]|uniref:restriction endonuclease subunit S n=1 Tax=Treponema denticola TaxID=158 RepID=UPI0020A40DF4|nr:restriction endonuclease subunit S [Treponema denticola]UTC99090.1 restriction endonuclease subunit S [Treponema denticola]
MNTNALRQKILDLAIHGKLVKQDPADESATILLEKIRAEKEKKIASGELKRGKNDSYIFFGDDNRHYEKFADGRVKDIEDEIPFAVPEGWAWCRLGVVADIARGGSPRPIEDFITDKKNGINWIKIGDTVPESKYIISAKEKIKPEGKKHSRFVHAGDFLLTNSMSFGRPYILKIDGCIHDGWLVFADIIKYLLKDFLYYALSSKYIYNSFSLVAAGSTVKNLKADTVKQVLFPLPPLLEQKRIITNIEAIFAQIDLLEQNKADLQTAVKQAKSKILDLAIRGKLVPQDPTDEPASVMLEKLHAEKEAKIVAGEIKRGKYDSYIYKNSTDNCYYEKFEGSEEQIEIPFDLPEGWCWQKISSICEINPKNKLDNTLEISFVPMTLIDSEFNNNFTYELQRWETVKSGFSHFADNDIGIAKITPCFENRKSVIFKNLKNKYGAGTTELHILRTNNEYIFNEYVFWFIKTDTFIKEGINNFTGAVGQQRIGKEFIAETLIPIPPLNEQIKICRTINKLMKKLDKISLNIV